MPAMSVESLNRYLKQYPFLWAIERGWPSSDTRIKVEVVDSDLLDESPSKDLPWGYFSDDEGYNSLYQVTSVGIEETIGAALLNLTLINQQFHGPSTLELVVRRVWRKTSSTIIIYKPPKRSSYEQMLKRFS
jgi:hypothetical protein